VCSCLELWSDSVIMKVGLIDLDNTGFPNLALMKLSAWHKKKGDEISFNFPLNEVDQTYVSCVFPKNRHKLPAVDPVIFGGTGFGWQGIYYSELPPQIEHTKPDYSLYNTTASYGFTSRGCIRHCRWCIVPEKEGEIRPHASIYEFWDRKFRDIILLDNNLLASPNWQVTLTALLMENLRVDFNQGLDIRLVTHEKASYLARLKLIKRLRFAFDDIRIEKQFRSGIDTLKKAKITLSSLSIYFLIGFNSSLEEDLERLRIIQGYGASPFAMKYEEVNGVKATVDRSDRELHEFARWVNLPHGYYKHFSFGKWLEIRGVKSEVKIR